MSLAIGYVRRSTNRQEESLEQQKAKLLAFAASKGWTLGQVYQDDAISGSDMQRPGLEALMRHAEENPSVEIVLAWERNRLARPKDPVDGLLLERRLIQAGKRVCYVATGQEADRSFTSGLVGFVEHYQNGDYLRRLSRDTMRGRVARAQRGLRSGGKVPFGYDRLCLGTDGAPKRIIRDLPDGTQLLLHPETQEVMEHITDGHRYIKPDHETVTHIPSEPDRVKAIQSLFHDYAAGVPIRILRNRLNAAGMRTATRGVFTIGSLHTILRNPAYKGVLTFNRRTVSKWHRHVGGASGHSVERHGEGIEARPKEDWIVIENAWPALVDKETFEKVQTRLLEGHNRYKPCTGRAIKAEYVLSGSFACGICGSMLIGHTSSWKHKAKGTVRNRSYICSAHHKGDYATCPTRFRVPADVVEKDVFGLIQQDLEQLKGDKELHAYVNEELQKLCGSQLDAKKGLLARTAELDSQIGKLTTHLSVLDVQTATMLGLYAKAKTLTDERQRVQAELEALNAGVPELPEPREIARKADEALAHLDTLLASGTLEENRELLRTYVKGMKVDPAAQEIEVRFLPALFSRIGTCEEPQVRRACEGGF